MKCLSCGAKMVTTTEPLFHYTVSGLSNVYLANVDISRCRKCHEEEVAIPRIEQLHKALATVIVKQTSRLAAEEIRFLRKTMGLSGADFARRIDVTASQVSRWERGHETMSHMAERLLRLMVVTESPVMDYSTELFERIAEDVPRSQKRVMAKTAGGWQAQIAAA